VSGGISGEDTGIGRLYAEHCAAVYRLAYRMTGNRQDAEDITQETFLRVHDALEGFRGQSAVSTWIFTIAKNLCYTRFRQATRSSFATLEAFLEHATDIVSPLDIDASQRASLAAQVRDGCLGGLVRCLTFDQRAAFVLRVLVGLKTRDVAEILGKSPGAVRVLVHRARGNLRAFLCTRCSAYDANNACRCENLIGFSLERGWIERPGADGNTADLEQITSGIQDIRDVIALYADLPQPELAQERAVQIRALLGSDDRGPLTDGPA
jgi:RNA polymerase sigma factor (sigma-70 family)